MVIRYRFTVKIVGMRNNTPMPPKTTSAFRAAPSDQPRRIKYPETPPPKKLPKSAARKGTHTARRPLLSDMPFATREMGNQSVTKDQTGSARAVEMIGPQVGGSFRMSHQRNRDL